MRHRGRINAVERGARIVGIKEAIIREGVQSLRGLARSSAVRSRRRLEIGEIRGVVCGVASDLTAKISKGRTASVVAACQPNCASVPVRR